MSFTYYETEAEWKEAVWESLIALKDWIKEYEPDLTTTYQSHDCNPKDKTHYWREVIGRSNYEYLEPGIENGLRHFYCKKTYDSESNFSITTAIGDDCPKCINLDEEEQDECQWCEGGRYFQIELFGLTDAKNQEEAWSFAFDLRRI